jgi:hypothetical protein
MKLMSGSGFYAKDVMRVAWHEGKFPHATLVLEFDRSEIIDCPDWATLQGLSEGALIRHDGQFACVLEYAFDDANYPFKSEPNGQNHVFLLSAQEMAEIQANGRLTLRFDQNDAALTARFATISREGQAA